MPIRDADIIIPRVCSGLAHLHSLGLIHGDVSADNVLLLPSAPWVKVCDLGGVQSVNGAVGSASFAVKIGYSAPEIVVGKVSTKTDTFTTSVLGYFLLSGKLPYSGNSLRDYLNQANSGLHLDPARLVPAPPDRIIEALRRGLRNAPESRPTIVDFSKMWLGDELSPTCWSPETLNKINALSPVPQHLRQSTHFVEQPRPARASGLPLLSPSMQTGATVHTDATEQPTSSRSGIDDDDPEGGDQVIPEEMLTLLGIPFDLVLYGLLWSTGMAVLAYAFALITVLSTLL